LNITQTNRRIAEQFTRTRERIPMMSGFVAKAYSLLVTTLLVTMLLQAKTNRNSVFDEITVHRINVVEPDGTLRMIISNHASFPGLIDHGKEKPYPRPFAGMLFYNNEGTENGGLVFGGHKDDKGQIIDSGGSLSFDSYGHSQQVIQVAGVDDAHDKFSGLAVSGFANTGVSSRRVWVGRDASGSASVALMDAQGKKRIVMQVRENGDASLLFLDDQGKVIKEIVP
jgi:hypothetical protein